MQEIIKRLKAFIEKALGNHKVDYTDTSDYGDLPEVAIWTTAQINKVTSNDITEITRLAVFRYKGKFSFVGIDKDGLIRDDLLKTMFPEPDGPEPCPPKCNGDDSRLTFEKLGENIRVAFEQ